MRISASSLSFLCLLPFIVLFFATPAVAPPPPKYAPLAPLAEVIYQKEQQSRRSNNTNYESSNYKNNNDKNKNDKNKNDRNNNASCTNHQLKPTHNHKTLTKPKYEGYEGRINKNIAENEKKRNVKKPRRKVQRWLD